MESVKSGISSLVDGEASESDEEIPNQPPADGVLSTVTVEPILTDAPNTDHTIGNNPQTNLIQPSRDPGRGIMVLGEAPESDEDFEDIPFPQADLTSLKVELDSPTEQPVTKPRKFEKRVLKKDKHDSLLHQKLKEKNKELHKLLESYAGSPFLNSGRAVRNITHQLTQSLAVITEVSYNTRVITNDLFHLEDKIDIVTSCHILPDIKI